MSRLSGAPEAAPSPFSFPLFRALWIANLVGNFGYLIQSVGAAWLMTQLAGTPRMVALVQASVTLPVMLLALVAGAIADSFDRRRVLLAAQVFMFVVSLLLAVLAATGLVTPVSLLLFTFLIGCGMAVNGPAWQASVGELVPRPALSSAVAYNSVSFNLARTAGPAIGGAIVATVGAAGAFLANSVSYIGLIVVLRRWRPEHQGETLPPERIGSAVASGLRYVAMTPAMLRVMARAVMFGSFASATSALMPVIARDLMHGGAIVYGLLLCAFGLGSVAGALLGGRLRGRASAQAIVSLAASAVAAGAAIVAVSHTLFVTLPALVLAGAGFILTMTTLNVTMQLSAPRWVVARAIALYQTSAFAGLSLGAAAFGAVASAYGIRNALLTAAGLQMVAVLIGQVVRLPEVDGLNLDPLRRWREPTTEVPVQPRSGPVTITIGYRIEPEDAADFLRAMTHRRRIRRRDGARRWSLARDLANPRRWVETYQVPSWLEYVRHNQRRTHADAAHEDRIRALHRGAWPPEIGWALEVDPASSAPS
ncbi:MFS transporter [Sphingomonas sp.]|uniref:MFS transporter n=1 Tax=Sphingomonas sp. TaxID=28214 RepID=UPI001B02CD5E|nr:MFS transporter [Sphingomonas sp.]MBO9715105.1 MFS transporter [Sphingomonas sp.]